MSKPIGKMNLKELKDFVADKIKRDYTDVKYNEEDFFGEYHCDSIHLGGLSVKDVIGKFNKIRKNSGKHDPVLEDIGMIDFSYYVPFTLVEARKRVVDFVKGHEKLNELLKELKKVDGEIKTKCGVLVNKKKKIIDEIELLECMLRGD